MGVRPCDHSTSNTVNLGRDRPLPKSAVAPAQKSTWLVVRLPSEPTFICETTCLSLLVRAFERLTNIKLGSC